jgi:hypothetical protein
MEFVAGNFSSIYRAALASSWGMNITKLMPLSAVDCMRHCSDARGVRCEGSTTPLKAGLQRRVGCATCRHCASVHTR